MDTSTTKILNAIDAYLEHPPHGAPEQIVDYLGDMREMLSAPRLSEESPGERSAREVAEATMPEEVSEEYYSNDSMESDNSDVGVFQEIS